MKTPSSFMEAFKQSATVHDVLVQMGMASDHTWCREQRPAYAARMEELISGGLRGRNGDQGPRSLSAFLNRLEREAFDQPNLPFPEEQVPRKSLEELVAAFEGDVPVLWIDEELGEVTIRMAISSPDLMKRAIELTHNCAVRTREVANRMNWRLKIILELARRASGDE